MEGHRQGAGPYTHRIQVRHTDGSFETGLMGPHGTSVTLLDSTGRPVEIVRIEPLNAAEPDGKSEEVAS